MGARHVANLEVPFHREVWAFGALQMFTRGRDWVWESGGLTAYTWVGWVRSCTQANGWVT